MNVKKFITIIVAGGLVLCCFGGIFAEAASHANDIQGSAQRLIADIDDVQARTYFKEMASEASWLSESERMKAIRICELISYLDFLRQRLSNLTRTKVDIASLGRLEQRTEYPEFSIDDIAARLASVKDELVERIRQEQLKRVQLKPKIQESAPTSMHSASEQLEIINVMRGEVGKLRESFKSLQDRMTAADARIERLTDEVASKTLENLEKERIIIRQKQELADMEQRLRETNERFNLGQKLLREKNDQIEALEDSDKALGGLTDEGGIDDLRAKFASLQLQFDEQMRASKTRLSVVESLLAEQEKRMMQYTLDLRAKGEQLESLTNLVLERSRQVSELNAALASKDAKLLELGGIIQIYKEKLIESNRLLQQRINELKIFEEEKAREEQTQPHLQTDLGAVDEGLIFLRERLKNLP